jgi:alpha-ketoglutarate-dependent sulfate ester dioxygenase
MTLDTTPALGLEVRALTGRTGAELRGVDLARVDGQQVAAIRQAILTHRVVFLRNQDLGPVEHLAFASRLGPLTLGHPTLPQLTEEEAIFDLDSMAGASANHWHTGR